MRDPKVRNKYRLTVPRIERLRIKDRSKICEPLFFRNEDCKSWNVVKTVPSTFDSRMIYTCNEFLLSVLDEPDDKGKEIRVGCYCYGGMAAYHFTDFFNKEELDSEYDLELQEELLRTVNKLIDDGILGFK